MSRALFFLVLVAACAHGPRGEPKGESRGELLGEGMASFYGSAFRGRPTANGERFDPEGMTAAHRTLPFDTCLRVEAVETGRSVKVRVNDRGPYAKGRILDLAEGAARALGIAQRGVARVRLWSCR